VSEYRYYEFQAIDRPLDERQMRELRALSTRAIISPTSFTNVYNWGNFRGDPRVLMERYFDAFVYVTNWGTYRFMLRFPRPAVDVEAASSYCVGESAALDVKGDKVILDLCSQMEPEGWEEGEGRLPSLIPLRGDIMAGDLRGLFLGWLLCAQSGEPDEDATEPPIPPGMGRLSASLGALSDFLRIDADLLEVAAERSADEEPPEYSRDELAAWVAALPESERNAMLVRLAEDDAPYLRWELLRRFRLAQAGADRRKADKTAAERRTVAELLAAAEARAEERRRRTAEREAKERRRRAREEAAARAKDLDDLSGREDDTWRQVEALIEAKRPKEYDRAVELLRDLREVGARKGQQDAADARVRSEPSTGRSAKRNIEPSSEGPCSSTSTSPPSTRLWLRRSPTASSRTPARSGAAPSPGRQRWTCGRRFASR